MHISQMRESKFLKKEDCGRGILVTIESVDQYNVAKEGADPEMKWGVKFAESDKPMICNSTNAHLIAKICGNEDTDGWVGHKVVLYEDPNISFGGKIVGGIRVRAPKNQPVAKPAAKAKPAPAAAPAATVEEPTPAEPPDEATENESLPF